MNRLISSSKMYFKRNGSTILTIAGAAGVVVTTVTAVKATPKAIALLEEAEETKGSELTVMQKIVVATPAYIPSIVFGASTIACIFGANALNKRKQAAMMSAYALLDNSYKEFKKKVKDIYGEESEALIREQIVKDKYADYDLSLDNGNELFYDFNSGRYFETTQAKLIEAEYELNRKIQVEGYACVNDFYALLDIDPIPSGYDEGWSAGALYDMYWQSWVDFGHEKTMIIDEEDDYEGLECTIVVMHTEPIFGFEEYC